MSKKVGILAVVCIIITFIAILLSASWTEQTRLSTGQSLYEHDSCSPPCWFGLIAGTSSTRDISIFIEQNDRLITLRDDSSIEEALIFHWKAGAFSIPPSSYVVVEDGTVSWMDIASNAKRSLNDVLRLFGSPDRIGYAELGDGLIMVYEEFSMVVSLHTDEQNCSIDTMGDDFWLSRTEYFTESDLHQSEKYNSRLLAIPTEAWDTWMSESYMAKETCVEAFRAIRQQNN